MNYLKAFIAGITLPSVLVPIFLCIAHWMGKTQVLTVPFLHLIPVLWVVWNVIYFAGLKEVLPKDRNINLLLIGGILGLLIAAYGVFWLKIPLLLGLSPSFFYLPLILAPILYALLWRYIVAPLNDLLQVNL